MSTKQKGVANPLIVVGMHRSGTSFVASLLHAAGLDMGSRLMPPARGNERGHFENMDFVEFHRRELRLTGHDDSGWAALHSLTLFDDAASEAQELLKANARASAWGWKDPRTTLFLEFWSSVVPGANYLFVYREPSEVIDSLYRRGDESIRLSPELAARAYLLHNEMMLRHAHLHRAQSILANVSAIAHDPPRFLATIAQKFGVHLNANAISTFEGALMHTIVPDAPRATLLRHLVPEIDRLYSNLEREADFPSSRHIPKRASLRKVKEAFFSNWLIENTREAELVTRGDDSSAQLEKLEHQRSTAALREAELQDTIGQRDAELHAIREALHAAEASNSQRGAHLAEAERLLVLEREATRAEHAHLRETIADFEAELENARIEKQHLEARLENARIEKHHLEAQLENARIEKRDIEAQLENARIEKRDIETQLENAQIQSRDIQQRLERTTREHITQTEALIAATRAESDKIALLISTVQSSSFWKIKRGINRVLRFLGARS